MQRVQMLQVNQSELSNVTRTPSDNKQVLKHGASIPRYQGLSPSQKQTHHRIWGHLGPVTTLRFRCEAKSWKSSGCKVHSTNTALKMRACQQCQFIMTLSVT